MIEHAIPLVQKSLNENAECEVGLLARNRVFSIDEGPSGGPELLALVFADNRYAERFWYAHVRQMPDDTGYAALLVCCKKFINAPSVRLLFQRFHHWTEVDSRILPAVVQHDEDAFAERGSIIEAALALSKMISRFDLQKRSGMHGSNYKECSTATFPLKDDPAEMRIFSVYDTFGSLRSGEKIPPPPISQKPALVESGKSDE